MDSQHLRPPLDINLVRRGIALVHTHRHPLALLVHAEYLMSQNKMPITRSAANPWPKLLETQELPTGHVNRLKLPTKQMGKESMVFMRPETRSANPRLTVPHLHVLHSRPPVACEPTVQANRHMPIRSAKRTTRPSRSRRTLRWLSSARSHRL